METSLHRDLKRLHAGPEALFEVPLGRYRIDAVDEGRLIEIQHGSLGAIRDKVRDLLADHRVLVVKPIVVRKQLIKLSAKGGEVTSRRLSPKRGQLLDLFDELIHFTSVFPHRRLTLEVPLVEIEEWRYPGHGRRRRWRENDFEIEDQKLVAVHQTTRLRAASDLVKLVLSQMHKATDTRALPRPFHTGHLAERLGVDRWVAQRIAYCLRETRAIRSAGKQGNARLYELPRRRRRRIA